MSIDYEYGDPLSSREIEVLHLIARGLGGKEIASCLYISYATARMHKHNIYVKLGAYTPVQAVRKGLQQGILCYSDLLEDD